MVNVYAFFNKILKFINFNMLMLGTNGSYSEVFIKTLEEFHIIDSLSFIFGYAVSCTALSTTKVFMKDNNDTVGKILNALTSLSLAIYFVKNKKYIIGKMLLSIEGTIVYIVTVLIIVILCGFVAGKDISEIPFYIRVILLLAFLIVILSVYLEIFFREEEVSTLITKLPYIEWNRFYFKF